MINIIILAAGESSRLGTPKQLLKFKGKSLIHKTIDTAKATIADHIFVVLGAFHDAIAEEIKDVPAEHIAVNENWKNGMGSSIKKGLARCLHLYPETKAIILMTCDQLYLTPDVLDGLILRYKNGSNIVASSYNNTLGVPVLFTEPYFSELNDIADHEDAKKLIKDRKVDSTPFEKGIYNIGKPEDIDLLD